MIGNHKDTNKYPINLLIINYLYNFFIAHKILFYSFLNSFSEKSKKHENLLSDKFFVFLRYSKREWRFELKSDSNIKSNYN